MKNTDYYGCTRPDVLEFLPASLKRLLDVGCGAGAFGELVKRQRGAEVWGIELNAPAARQAAARLDQVRVGPVEQVLTSLPERYFDCITFNDVLEHLVDPYAVLRDVTRVLAPGGCVVASIPNLRYWAALKHIIQDRDFRYTDHGTFDATHLRFFTKKSIGRMFDEQGYDLVRIDGINEQLPHRRLPRTCFRVINWMMPVALDDTRYVQFACVAVPR